MANTKIEEVRRWEEEQSSLIDPSVRPFFHLSSRLGWMNDPNGFSEYKDEVHLFYQYFPYKAVWGPMHWGHAVTNDFVKWEYRKVALAPDTPADIDGCFSGSAVTLDDGRQMLMYTGVVSTDKENGKYLQRQCLAFGDGYDYEKYEGNPVLDESDLPEGLSKYDFRDPKMNKEADGTYTCVVGGCTEDLDGRILYFRSKDGLKWEFVSVLASNNHRFGTIWECPDYFELDGKRVLLCSPMNMTKKDEYSDGHGTLCLIGEHDNETNTLIEEYDQPIDYGVDFYATQTLECHDGRRIMIAWLQSWHTLYDDREEFQWYGQMILPRVLTIKNNRLYQTPVKEIEAYRSDEVVYNDLDISYECQFKGIEGRCLDMTLDLDLSECDSFMMKFAMKENDFVSFLFDKTTNELTFDRSNAHGRVTDIDCRSFKVRRHGETLKMRILLDAHSVECFLNDGEQVFTATFDAKRTNKEISFLANGVAKANIVSYTLKDKE